jgi:DNA repair ATPase RecN
MENEGGIPVRTTANDELQEIRVIIDEIAYRYDTLTETKDDISLTCAALGNIPDGYAANLTARDACARLTAAISAIEDAQILIEEALREMDYDTDGLEEAATKEAEAERWEREWEYRQMAGLR